MAPRGSWSWFICCALLSGAVACGSGQAAAERGATDGSGSDSRGTEAGAQTVKAGSDGTIKLLAPRTKGGMPFMEAMWQRRTQRRYQEKQLPLRTLSELMWAAVGVNRPGSGKRTNPTAMRQDEIDLYAALPQGLFLYEPVEHVLKRIHTDDIRRLTGRQRLVRSAAVDLIFVADYERMEMSEEERVFYSTVDTGYVSQNVYLFCAAERLGTVAIGMVDRGPLRAAMKLRPRQKIILTQAVGYPR